jgi:hypothetical protein
VAGYMGASKHAIMQRAWWRDNTRVCMLHVALSISRGRCRSGSYNTYVPGGQSMVSKWVYQDEAGSEVEHGINSRSQGPIVSILSKTIRRGQCERHEFSNLDQRYCYRYPFSIRHHKAATLARPFDYVGGGWHQSGNIDIVKKQPRFCLAHPFSLVSFVMRLVEGSSWSVVACTRTTLSCCGRKRPACPSGPARRRR